MQHQEAPADGSAADVVLASSPPTSRERQSSGDDQVIAVGGPHTRWTIPSGKGDGETSGKREGRVKRERFLRHNAASRLRLRRSRLRRSVFFAGAATPAGIDEPTWV